MNVLDVNDICKSFDGKSILKNINLSIAEGEIIGLIGPNGAGKTTIMKMIAGLVPEDSGTIKVCGTLLNDDRNKYLSSFSSIIENPSFYEMLSGYDNLNFIRKVNNVSIEKMKNIIEFINIGDALKNKVRTYSLGMKQRLSLGIALLTEPKLLILDEPTNGLDPEGVMELRKLITESAKKNKMSVLISSHILTEIDKMCTRVLFIKDGQLIENEKVEKDKENQTIILTVKDIDVIYEKIKDIDILKKITTEDNRIYLYVNKNNTPKLMSILMKNSIEYENIEISNNSIEEIYKDIYLGEGKDE
ncbi:MAG: ABC transporter ATP-binding protein [Inconstantimicrobium porci]|uniref:ABC transporter ATP-binding protein n=1 Tax=Inconstantimicrobium porci TaxID=2652291 RepID=A0A7X2MZD1_9CLOT|nr:ABC transporter ATP-binding protein [Inconstantimicrobium porci]MDD6771248.1 ABC transporter ATP-binding protein [Inconstantimicrobium porci]MDY5910627.1 ABC transporter ATP-binding protein [Inconstantimicrobium porci]MSR91864.1 ABC transporter ATP-binding protein [Inconstantimicrobium porci]